MSAAPYECEVFVRAKHTPGRIVVERPSDGRSPLRLTTPGPMFDGATLPAEIARVTKLRGACGFGTANAERLAHCWNTHDEMLDALRAGAELVRGYMKESGGCDHSVGICYCGDQRVLADMDAAIAKAGA